jgi:hypothetical protein
MPNHPQDDLPVEVLPIEDPPVDESEGIPIPVSDEVARHEHTPEEEERARQAALDSTVEGNTRIDGLLGGERFFGADPPQSL